MKQQKIKNDNKNNKQIRNKQYKIKVIIPSSPKAILFSSIALKNLTQSQTLLVKSESSV